MDNYVQRGQVLELTAPVGGVVSGSAYLIGQLLVVATVDAAAGEKFSGYVGREVVALPKVAEEAWTENLKLYWDDTAKKITKVVASNKLVGVAAGPFAAAAVTLATSALAADLLIAGLTLTVLDFATLGTDNATVTVTINGTATVLTEGAGWTAAASNDATATSLAAAISALTGVTATAATNVVTVAPATGVGPTSLTTGKVRLDGVTR
jgi:predicted RecA/RadA family phage recombinase